MTYYTIWYIDHGVRVVWATGYTLEEAQAAVSVIKSEFGFTAGMDEESK